MGLRSMTRERQQKVASELTHQDIGKRIFNMHGTISVVTGKPIPTYNIIKEIKLTASGVEVTVYRGRFETSETYYSLNETVQLIYYS